MGGYIGNTVTAQSADSTIYLPVRQTVLTGSSSAGVPNFMAAGTGLRVALSAAATPMAIAFANGFSTYGAQDYVSRLIANNSDMTGADLTAQNTNYIFATYTNNASVVWGNTVNPPQYGITYDRTRNALLHFEGVDATTSMIDDYGNTWTAVGNAQIDTAQFKVGTSSLLLDGTGDYVESTEIKGLSSGGTLGWTIEGYFRFNVLPTAGQNMTFFSFAQNATDFGVMLELNNTAATIKSRLTLSSNGTTTDILAPTLGTSTVWATNTWYHMAVTYDALSGKYFVYKDGVQDTTTTSALRICEIVRARIGERCDATLTQFNGWVDEFRVSSCCRYGNGATFTPSTSALPVEGHWFDTVSYQMWEATTASAVAGTAPTFTQRNRVFVGEADTSGAGVTAVRNYAYQGRALVDAAAVLAGSTAYALVHNLGTVPQIVIPFLVNVAADLAYVPGEEATLNINYTDGANDRRWTVSFPSPTIGRATCGVAALAVQNRTAGIALITLFANWKFRFRVSRGW